MKFSKMLLTCLKTLLWLIPGTQKSYSGSWFNFKYTALNIYRYLLPKKLGKIPVLQVIKDSAQLYTKNRKTSIGNSTNSI